MKFEKIVDVKEVGEHNSYDLEIESKDHNFFANDICVSNSHSLSYSYNSFRQLWQKYYYTIEFYCAAFNNEPLDEFSRIVSNIQKFPARKIVDGKSIEYQIKVAQPCLKLMNSNFAIDGDNIRHGLQHIKYISPAAYDIMKANLTEQHFDDFEKLITSKYIKNEKNKSVIDKKLATALIYSGALDYLGISRSDLAQKYNEVRKSDIEVIKEDKEISKLEEYYLGYSEYEQRKVLNIRTKLEAMKNYKPLSELKNEESNGMTIDFVRIKEIKEKKSKRGNPFRVLTVETSDSEIGPIFVWDPDIILEKKKYYLGKFQKEDEFVKMISATEG